MTRQEARAYRTELYEMAVVAPGPNEDNRVRVKAIRDVFHHDGTVSRRMKEAVDETSAALIVWFSEGPWNRKDIQAQRRLITAPLVRLSADIETDLD